MDEMSWEIRVPLLKNKIIQKQLFISIGVPFGALFILLILIKAYNGLIILGATFLLAYLIILVVFRGTYDVHYVIDSRGILCENQKRQAKRVKRMSFFTLLFGLFSGNATAAGTGMLASSRTKEFFAWKNIKKARYIDRQRCIMLHAGFAENTALFCTEDNFKAVKSLVAGKLKASE